MTTPESNRPWLVKYDGTCFKCGTILRKGTPAVWHRARRQMSCITCPNANPGTDNHPPSAGEAGGSARTIHDSRRANYETEVRERWGPRVGRLITRFVAEPQSIRAWGLGAHGEELLAAALAQVPGLVVLNDRGVKGSKANIDHIAIAPAGVFVLDAKLYSGFIEVVDKGTFVRSDRRLMIGGRNRSDLTKKMGWQLKSVTKAFLNAGVDPLPPITAVLCFVQPSWAVFRRPKSFDGVQLESEKTIVPVLGKSASLSDADIDRFARILDSALRLSSASRYRDNARPALISRPC